MWQYFVFFLTNKLSVSLEKKNGKLFYPQFPWKEDACLPSPLPLNLHNNFFEFTGQLQTCLVSLINSFSLRK